MVNPRYIGPTWGVADIRTLARTLTVGTIARSIVPAAAKRKSAVGRGPRPTAPRALPETCISEAGKSQVGGD